MARRLIALLVALVAAAGVVLGVARVEPPLPWPAPARGGESFSVLLPLADFDQDDPAWSAVRIGGSQESIAEVGCALCSAAMVSTWLGAPISPAELNRRLIAQGGYTSRGWLRWQAVADASGGHLRLTYAGAADHRRIDAGLRAGVPSIVKLSRGHWVVVVGKDGDEYLVNDPLADRRGVVPLSSIAAAMLAQREFRAPPPGGWRDR